MDANAMGNQIVLKIGKSKNEKLFRMADKCYQVAIQGNPLKAEYWYNYAKNRAKWQGATMVSVKAFARAVHLKMDFSEAYADMGANLLALGQVETALRCCEIAVRLHPDLKEGYYNIGVALRILGRQKVAVQRFTALIEADALMSMQWTRSYLPNEKEIMFACVKWGTKYNAEYVNKLYYGLCRHVRHKVDLVCFTEDDTDLHPDIQIHPLSPGFTGWWNKVQLFSPSFTFQGRLVYIDLDTIVVGNLDPLLQYNGPFATLSTNRMVNENRLYGLNTSVMLFDPVYMHSVYEYFSNHSPSILKYIYKFDHFIEMIIPHADTIQEDIVLEYKQYSASNSEKDTAALITFPLIPKPHELLKGSTLAKHWTTSFYKVVGS